MISKRQKASPCHLHMADMVFKVYMHMHKKSYPSISNDPPVHDLLGRRAPSSSSSCFPTKFYLSCLVTHQNVLSCSDYLCYNDNAIQKRLTPRRLMKIIPMCKFSLQKNDRMMEKKFSSIKINEINIFLGGVTSKYDFKEKK